MLDFQAVFRFEVRGLKLERVQSYDCSLYSFLLKASITAAGIPAFTQVYNMGFKGYYRG